MLSAIGTQEQRREIRNEIKELFNEAEKIEKKYPDGIIQSRNDEDRLKALLSQVNDLENKLVGIEIIETRQKALKGEVVEIYGLLFKMVSDDPNLPPPHHTP